MADDDNPFEHQERSPGNWKALLSACATLTILVLLGWSLYEVVMLLPGRR